MDGGDRAPTGLRAAHGRGAGRPAHPALVQRRARPAQVVRHLAGRARERVRGGHAVRRVVDRRLQPGAGERRARPPRREQLRAAAVGHRRRAVGSDVLRHRQPRRLAVRRRPPAGAQAQPRARPRTRLHVLRRARHGVLLLRVVRPERAAPAARHVVVLRPHHRGRRRRHPQGDDPHTRGARHPGRVLASRGRAEPARDRPALHRRAHDGRQRDDVPSGREGGRARARCARDVHAEADGAGAGLGHAHALLAVRGRHQRVPRCRRPVRPVEDRPRVHRRPAAPRPRDQRRHQPVGELVQATRRRLRGARLHLVGAATTARSS